MIGTKQFKVPKVKAPQQWQNVIERKYNMVSVEDETFFVPGRASHAIHQVNTPVSQNHSVNPAVRRHHAH